MEMYLFQSGTGVRFLGLLLGVLHHGLGNMADESKPARIDTVIATGNRFTEYLKAGIANNND